MVRITGSILNKKSINQRVNNSKAFDKAAMNAAQKRLDKAKAELLAQYNEHPVTRELEDGETANNLSGSLSGYGNLFSFMGFSRGSNPTKAVGNFLKSFISLKKRSKKRGNTREYRVKMPSMEDFDFAQMPWEQGNSWVRAVEMGMTNFSYYMNKASKASRSGKGIQINNKLRGRGSSGVPYMTEMLHQFKNKLSR